jgi:hypothetical protein
MADQNPLTITCDSLDEFEDDAAGFDAEDPPIGASPVPDFPGPAALAAAKALWMNAIRQWATSSANAPNRFVTSKSESAYIEVTVRVGPVTNTAANPQTTTLRATAIDTSSDQVITLIDGSAARAIMWSDISNIAFRPPFAGPVGPPAAG